LSFKVQPVVLILWTRCTACDCLGLNAGRVNVSHYSVEIDSFSAETFDSLVTSGSAFSQNCIIAANVLFKTVVSFRHRLYRHVILNYNLNGSCV